MTTIKAETQKTKVSTTTNERVDNREEWLNRRIGWFFPATDTEKAFVGDKAEAIGTLKFRRAQFEKSDQRDVVNNPDSYNFTLLYMKDGKAGLMPMNVARDDENTVHVSHKTEDQFSASKFGQKSDHKYVVDAATLILTRALGVEKLPEGKDLNKLVESKLEDTESGSKALPIKRRHHMRASAQEQRRVDRIDEAKNGGEFQA